MAKLLVTETFVAVNHAICPMANSGNRNNMAMATLMFLVEA